MILHSSIRRTNGYFPNNFLLTARLNCRECLLLNKGDVMKQQPIKVILKTESFNDVKQAYNHANN